MKISKYLWMAAFVLPCALFVGCGDSDDGDDGKVNIDVREEGNPMLQNDSTAFNVDRSFVPSQSYIQKTWVGEYVGWDAVQEKNTNIRRTLTLNANMTYMNEIVGKLNDKEGLFERERGTYSYNTSTGIITYTCQSDSVLVYRDQTYNEYKAKHFYDHENVNYTEKAQFTTSDNGRRAWVTKDTYLQSLTALKIDLTFAMDVFDGDKKAEK